MNAEITRDNPFWNYSLRFYARPRVGDVCVGLQDRASVDVNVLLYLLWLSTAGKTVSSEEMRMVDARVKAWREQVVIPLRAIRRNLPKEATASKKSFRDGIKKLELQSERIEQDDLYAIFPDLVSGGPDNGSARANLARYAEYLNFRFEDEELEALLGAYADVSAR